MPPNIWPDEHSEALRDMMPKGRSFAVMADDLNRLFQTNYSRNSVIGRANRMFGPGTKGPSTMTKNPPRRGRAKRERKAPKPVLTAFSKPPRPSPEIIKLRCAEVEPRLVSLADLRADECHYPYGSGPYTFCGHNAVEGISYCEPHRLLCTRDDPRKPNQTWLTAVRVANVPKAIALSSGDWEAA